jgi:hypothetical protein
MCDEAADDDEAGENVAHGRIVPLPRSESLQIIL